MISECLQEVAANEAILGQASDITAKATDKMEPGMVIAKGVYTIRQTPQAMK